MFLPRHYFWSRHLSQEHKGLHAWIDWWNQLDPYLYFSWSKATKTNQTSDSYHPSIRMLFLSLLQNVQATPRTLLDLLHWFTWDGFVFSSRCNSFMHSKRSTGIFNLFYWIMGDIDRTLELAVLPSGLFLWRLHC